MTAGAFSFDYDRGALEREINAAIKPVAEAATAAMQIVIDDAKTKARAEIAAAGFSRRWQNALRGVVYPKGRIAPGPAGHIFSKIGYAGVFDKGATIHGSPLLWIPFNGVPAKLGREKMKPALFERRIGPLQGARIAGLPVLLAPMAMTALEARSGRALKITTTKLRRGARHEGRVRNVPIFFGRHSVTMPDKLSIEQIVERAGARLVSEFAAQFDKGR